MWRALYGGAVESAPAKHAALAAKLHADLAALAAQADEGDLAALQALAAAKGGAADDQPASRALAAVVLRVRSLARLGSRAAAAAAAEGPAEKKLPGVALVYEPLD